MFLYDKYDFEKTVIPNPNLIQAINVPRITLAEARRDNLPKEIYTSLNNRLVRIDLGDFKMGAGRREPGRKANEIEKRVSLTRHFFLASKEISNADYKKYDPNPSDNQVYVVDSVKTLLAHHNVHNVTHL